MTPLRRFVVTAALARTPSEGLSLAIVLLCVDRGVATTTAGVLVAATSLPQLVSGPVLGPRLDRATDVWRAVRSAAVMTAAAVAALVAGIGMAPVVVGLLAAVVVAIAEPTFTGGISAAVDRTVLQLGLSTDRPASRVHAWDSFSYNVAGLLAPALVTVVAATAGPAPAMAALAICVVGGGIMSIGLHTDPAHAHSRDTGVQDAGVRQSGARQPGVAAALRAIGAAGPLRAVTVSTTLAHAAFGGLAFAAVAAARDAGRSANAAGQLFTVLAVGGLIGSLVMTRRPAPVRPERTVATSLAAMGVAMISMAMVLTAGAGAWLLVLAGAAVVGLLDGPLLVGIFASRTHQAPAALRTTVFTVGASLKLGASALGAVVASHLLDDRATAAGLAVIGGVHVAAGGVCRLLGVAR